jgi:hypothetical protein
MSDNAIERVEMQFQWGDVAASIDDLYGDVLARARATIRVAAPGNGAVEVPA